MTLAISLSPVILSRILHLRVLCVSVVNSYFIA